MFGFLKRILGGADAPKAAPATRAAVVEIRAEDLDDPARLGPKLAAVARLRADVSGAEYDPAIEAVKIGYQSGGKATMFLRNAQPFLREALGGRGIADYLDNAFAEPLLSEEGYLLPVLKPAEYVEIAMAQLRAAGVPPDQPVPFWYRRLGTGLVVVLVRNTPTRMVSLSDADLAEAGLDEDAARQQAMSDLTRLCDERELRISTDEDGRLHQLHLDGNYDASTYFLSGIWDDLAARIGAPLVAVFAARNLVFYASGRDPEAMKLISRLADPAGEPPPYAIAPHQMLIWDEEGWAPLAAAPRGQDAPN